MVDSAEHVTVSSGETDVEFALPGMEPAAAEPTTPGAYRVLARKYRPRTFAELIGQDAMVRTLANAIKRGRLAHAFLMTGVRGVGKTSTARLIAKALNCVGSDGTGGPTIDPCGVCEHCQAIGEGRHIDVVEMDAASHTGIEDVREIIEAVRYASVSARYKIYIVDEVHMLSRAAFNGLLKTLEEPPEHVKFLFATTEVEKLPVTVLSRCQRFDLKRVPPDMLARHFEEIAGLERVPAEKDALALIAEAAEGSVRDGLSILDQAIAHAELSDGRVVASDVRNMLGLADRGAVRRLLGAILQGDSVRAVELCREQYRLGTEPVQLLSGLLSQVHSLTLAKVGAATGMMVGEAADRDVSDWAARLSHAQLHRLWQLLEAGHEAVRNAANQSQACEMALLRCVYAISLPDPGELVRQLGQGGSNKHEPSSLGPPANRSPADIPKSFSALLDRLGATGHHQVELVLRDSLRLIEYAPPLLRFQWSAPAPRHFEQQFAAALKSATGLRWTLEQGVGDAEPSGREQEEAVRNEHRAAALSSPVVQAALEAFSGAKLMDPSEVSSIPRSASA